MWQGRGRARRHLELRPAPALFKSSCANTNCWSRPDRGATIPPPGFDTAGIHILKIEGGYDDVSASAVRNRLQNGEPWEHLVPPQIEAMVREIYG